MTRMGFNRKFRMSIGDHYKYRSEYLYYKNFFAKAKLLVTFSKKIKLDEKIPRYIYQFNEQINTLDVWYISINFYLYR